MCHLSIAFPISTMLVARECLLWRNKGHLDGRKARNVDWLREAFFHGGSLVSVLAY